MSDEEARSEAGDLAIQIDTMVVRPEPVNWPQVSELAREIVRVAAEMVRDER